MDEDRKYLKGLLEALVFLSSEPVKLASLAKTVEIDKTLAREILDELILDYQEKEGGFLLREIAGQYQFITSDIYHERLGQIFKEKRKETLSRSNLDTLAIIAYKQPITLTEIDEIRGVSSRAMVANLMTKKLVKPVGQKEVPGRPTLYATTNEFLIHFGLSKLSDLPSPVDVKELNFEEIENNWDDESDSYFDNKISENENEITESQPIENENVDPMEDKSGEIESTILENETSMDTEYNQVESFDESKLAVTPPIEEDTLNREMEIDKIEQNSSLDENGEFEENPSPDTADEEGGREYE